MKSETDPTIWLYVVETGEEGKTASNRLAFHTFEDAKDWATDIIDRPGELAFNETREGDWYWQGPLGYWAKIRKTKVANPVRLLRDDRDDDE